MMEKIEELILEVIKARAVEIRDVPSRVTNEEIEKLPLSRQPFLYSSGNWGPGYVTIKNLVGRKKIIKSLLSQIYILFPDPVFFCKLAPHLLFYRQHA